MWVIIMGQAWVSHSNCMQLQVASHQWTWDVSDKFFRSLPMLYSPNHHGMGSILHGMRPREHIVGCISHTTCPRTHSHTLVMQCYYDLLFIMHIYIYIHIYTSAYISYITIYPYISHHGYRTLSVQIVSLGPLWGPSASPKSSPSRSSAADSPQCAREPWRQPHGSTAMAVAKHDDMVGLFDLFGQWW